MLERAGARVGDEDTTVTLLAGAARALAGIGPLVHRRTTITLVAGFCVTVAVMVGCTAYLVSALSSVAAR